MALSKNPATGSPRIPRGRIHLFTIATIGATLAVLALLMPVAHAVVVDPPAWCIFSRVGDTATVQFAPSTDRDAAFHIIERNRNNIGWRWADRIDPDEEPTHINQVKARDAVRFRVRALSANRTSSERVACSEEAPLPDRLAPVKNLRVVKSTASSVTVDWKVDGDPRHISYDFFVNNRYVGYGPDETTTTHTFEGLQPNKTYTLGVTVTGDRNADWVGKSYSPRENVSASTDGDQSERVIWRDDFDTLDTSVWRLENDSIYGIKSAQCYLDDNVTVRNGSLVMTAKNQKVDCFYGKERRDFTSGMVRSRGVTFGVGQAIEFRAKLTPADRDHQSGLWPALWVSGMGGVGWPWSGEIDFLEVMTAIDPKRSVYSMHYSTTAPPTKTHAKKSKAVYDDEYFSDQWHIIRFENRRGDLRWFIDGKQVHRVTSAPTYQGWPAPFDQPAREIRMNLTLGGEPNNKPTFVDPRGLAGAGATFMVDYVQISELTN